MSTGSTPAASATSPTWPEKSGIAAAPTLTWDEPEGLAPRGTVLVLPGRGEQPGVYERFGRRLAADAYRVHIVGDATRNVEEVSVAVKSLLEAPGRPGPAVLVGSDTGALLALRLVALGSVTVDGLVLAGLPDPERRVAVATDAEPEVRASCPTHQKLLRDAARGLFQAGSLDPDRIPGALREPLDPAGVRIPVLGLHGDNDQVSPLAGVHADYARLSGAELLTVADGRHDVLNAANHRGVAATVVLWLERLRLGAQLPSIIRPATERDGAEPDTEPHPSTGANPTSTRANPTNTRANPTSTDASPLTGEEGP